MKTTIITFVLLYLMSPATSVWANTVEWSLSAENVGQKYVLKAQGPTQPEKYVVLTSKNRILHSAISKSGAYIGYIIEGDNVLYLQILKTGARYRVSQINNVSGDLFLNEINISYKSDNDNVDKEIGLITLSSSSSGANPMAGLSDAAIGKLTDFAEIFLKVKEEYVDVVSDYKLLNACMSGMGITDQALVYQEKPDVIKTGPDAMLALINVIKSPAANITMVDYESKILGCTETMVESLDRLSYYMFDDWPGYKTSANEPIAGIGVSIDRQNDEYRLKPLIGGSAMAAGLPKNAQLLSIDNIPVTGLTVHKISRMLVGPPNSKVNIQLKAIASDQTSGMTIERRFLDSPDPIEIKWLHDAYLYIRIDRFESKISEKLSNKIELLSKDWSHGPKGIILDLRFNSGGLLSEAVGVDAIFLPKDQVVIKTIGRSKDSNLVLRTVRDDFIQNPKALNFINALPDWRLTAPIAVLINHESAGASELVAAALLHYKRTIVVGQSSLGNGTLQTIWPMYNGRALKITTGRYYSPSGESIDKGVTPSIETQQDTNLVEAKSTDNIVQEAIQHLSTLR